MNYPQTVFVTGASAGFGAALVHQFASVGSRVVAAARRTERLDDFVARYGEDRVLAMPLDVRSGEAVDTAIADLPAPFATVDCLVNNAGLALGVSSAQEANIDDWDRMIDTNCKGVVRVTRALLPGMIARKRGHVINIGSVAGKYPYPGGNVYGATKAFVHQFSLNLRSDLHGTGIRVTCIEPGMSGGTEFSNIRFNGDRDRATALYAGMEPLSAADIAETVRWSASLPAHVNVNAIELMPVAQSFAPYQVDRSS